METTRQPQTHMDDYSSVNIDNKNIIFSLTDMQKILKGYKAESMDDKWNIIYNNDYIMFQRSWTTTVVYKLHLYQKTHKSFSIDYILYQNNIDMPTDVDEILYMIMDLLNTFVLQ